MVDQARARRLAKRITQIVAAALEHEVKDPRLAMVTITDTRVTGDLREATVYYTVLGESVDAAPDTAGAAAALASATGVLRSHGRRGHRRPAHPVADRSCRTWCPTRPAGWRSCSPAPASPTPRWPGARSAPSPAGDPDPYRAPREAGRRRVTALVGARAAASREDEPGTTRTRTSAGRPQPRPPLLAAAPRTSRCWRTSARRRRAGQRAGAGHRPAPARRARCRCRSRAPDQCRRRCGRSTCTGWWCRRREVPPAPEVLVACDAAEPRPARPAGRPAGHRRTHGHARPPRHQPRLRRPADARPGAEATVVLVHRLLDAMGVPLDADMARCLYAGLVTDTRTSATAGRGRAPARRRADRGRGDPHSLVTAADGHPPVRLAGRARRSCCERAVLDPAAAGGLGLVHTIGPAAGRRPVPAPRRSTASSTSLRTAAEAEVAAVFKQVGPSAGGRSRCARAAGSTWPRRRPRSAAAGIRGAAGFTWEGTEDELLAALRAAL